MRENIESIEAMQGENRNGLTEMSKQAASGKKQGKRACSEVRGGEIPLTHLSCLGALPVKRSRKVIRRCEGIEGIKVSYQSTSEGVSFSCEALVEGVSPFFLQIYSSGEGGQTLQRVELAKGERMDYFYHCPLDDAQVSYQTVSEV